MYDPAKNSTCPYCGVPELKVGQTVARSSGLPASPEPNTLQTEGDATVAAWRLGMKGSQGDSAERQAAEPVVGWLVCVEGPAQGRDFSLRPQQNSIGRAADHRVSLTEDRTVTREQHAVVICDPRDWSFFVAPGRGSALAYHNGAPVLEPKKLEAFDALEVGASKLLFVPFCGARFRWSVE